MKSYIDQKYHFFELFNEKNGTLIRSNIMGTDIDAECRSFPELIDIGIMGSCHAAQSGLCKMAGIDCYQNAANSHKKDMTIEGYSWIIEQCKGKVFQVALGGAGDPNKHIEFEQILKITCDSGIVPNLTTSGYLLKQKELELIKEYCGAVAVSYYSRLIDKVESNNVTREAIDRFVKAGCVTNIHYVVSDYTIDEAIYRLENLIWPKGIAAIIFILYKPIGLGVREKKVKKDERLQRFMNLVLKNKYPFNIGFDTCFTPILCDYIDLISFESIDACEAAKFSMYIDCDLVAYPCSFDNQLGRYKELLNPKLIQEVWDGKKFQKFRNMSKETCCECSNKKSCLGGCHLDLEIDLC